MWTDFYEDIISGLSLVTYVLPVHDGEGKIAALFGLDMLTEQLGDFSSRFHQHFGMSPTEFRKGALQQGEI